MTSKTARRGPAFALHHERVMVAARHSSPSTLRPGDEDPLVPSGYPAGRARIGRRAIVLLVGDLLAMLASSTLTAGAVLSHLLIGVTGMAVLAHMDLYRFRCTVSLLDDLPWLGLGAAAGAVVGSVASDNPSVGRPTTLLVNATTVAVFLVAARGILYLIERRRRRRGGGKATLILGTGQVGRRLGQAMLEHPQYGLRLVGYLDDERRRRDSTPAHLLGRTGELGWWIEKLQVANVVVTFGSTRVAALVDIVRTCDRLRCEVLMVPRLFELHSSTRDTEHVHGIPLVRLRRAPFRRLSWQMKRVVDVVCSATAIIALSPVMLACAIAVRLDGGPVLFRQERVSVDGRRFQMYKFRTMTPNSSNESEQRWTIAGDPRVRPLGRLLRATSLDELPQLINVLRGDMSLVGPRPERPYFVEQLSQSHPRYSARQRVPAGLTGWAAVHGLRGDTSIPDRVEFDNSYIQNWSLWLDAKIMLRTLGAVLGRTGG